MKILLFTLILLVCLPLAGCIDEIKLDLDNDYQSLVVDGQLTDSLIEQTVKVSYSVKLGFATDNILPPVTGASVRVLDDSGGSFEFTETANGTYTRLMKGIPGQAYQVEVKTPDGKTILSRPAVLNAAPPLLPVTAKVVQEATVSSTGTSIYSEKLLLEMNTDVSGMAERPYLRWRASGEYEFGEDYPNIIDRKICYVKNNVDFNNISIFDTHKLAGGLLTNEPFLSTVYNYRFAYMYCFHLFQYSISEEEYEYWEQVKDIVNIDGSLFDPPPGTVKGNLYNPNNPQEQILGYFSVAGCAYRRDFMNAVSLGYAANPRCSNWPPQQPAECRECLNIPNSSVTRPPYWQP